MKRSLLLMTITFFILFIAGCTAQQSDSVPSLERFRDSAHHWYDIKDTDKIVLPREGHPLHNASQYEKIADNILLYQKVNGGFDKNYDMAAILTKEDEQKLIASKDDVSNTTYDNGATHSQVSYLAEVYTITKNDKYKKAFYKGMDYIFASQYDNGGFPQFYPDTTGYRKHITFNDGAMGGVMKLLYNIIYDDPNYLFVDKQIKEKAKKSFDKGIECILAMQINEDGLISVWCQQHYHDSLLPAPARTFEPAAICNGESCEVLDILMAIPNPDKRIIESVEHAVKWLDKAAINGLRRVAFTADKKEFIYHTSVRDVKVVEDPDAPRIWTRFTELGTHVPLFCRRDGRIVYSLEEVERERRDGYAWYIYEPERILNKYPAWHAKVSND